MKEVHDVFCCDVMIVVVASLLALTGVLGNSHAAVKKRKREAKYERRVSFVVWRGGGSLCALLVLWTRLLTTATSKQPSAAAATQRAAQHPLVCAVHGGVRTSRTAANC